MTRFLPKYPLHVVFILGNWCNLHCTHCPSNAGLGASWGYTTDETKKIIDQLVEVGVLDIALSGGEPLLRRDLPELVAYARSLGLTVGTSTNGYPLTDRVASALRQAGLSRLQVSIDSIGTTHESVRGSGSFQRAIAAVERSVRHGLKTHICFTAMRRNAHELPQMLNLARQFSVDGFNLSQFVPTGRGSTEDALDPVSARKLLEIWLEARGANPDMYMTVHSSGLAALAPTRSDCRGGCQAGISIACITADGDVTPCVMLPLSLGNIKERTFSDIWSQATAVTCMPGT
jgi:MoaA/NifB/PqqE/SkfB family radical SAM enzyme